MTTHRETYTFVAAHSLPTFPEGHKCRRVHGHTYNVEIEVTASDGERGYAFDHADLDEAAVEVLGQLDHQTINDVDPELRRGLSEDVLRWIVSRLGDHLPDGARLDEVVLDEMSSGRALRLVHHRKVWRRPPASEA